MLRTDHAPHVAETPRAGRFIAAGVVIALSATAGITALTSAPSAVAAYPDTFNPFAMNGGFTVYARDALTMGNDETEGSLAAGGTATTAQGSSDQYTIIHVSAGTANYTLPTVDGDPTRLLVGSYSPSSAGILAITSAGTSDPSLHGDLKMVQRDGPWQAFTRSDWIRLNLNAGNVDQTPLIDATHQQYPAHASPPASPTGNGSIYTFDTGATAVADYVEASAEASYEQAKDCLDGINDPSGGVGYPVGIAENAGDRVVLEPLSDDRPNVVQYADVAATGLIQFSSGPTPGVPNPLIIRVPAGTTTVNAARVDPQGTYSPYIFWDLSEITGSVTVNAAQSRIDGSIYAPNATVTVNASPLDGQVLGQNVILQGGEVHSFLFAGQISCAAESGSFEISKSLSGITEDELPAGTTFTVNYTATEPDGTVTTDSIDLPASGESVSAGVQFPLGTVIEFQEIPPASVPGYLWGTPTITANPMTVGEDPAEVVVANTATLLAGTFSVTKRLTNLDRAGPAAPQLTGSVPVAWTAFLGGETYASGSLDVPLDGTTVPAPQNFPLGTRIVLSEDLSGVDPPDGYEWISTSWDPGRAFVITRADTTTAVVLTNALAPIDLGPTISVAKEVEGEGADPRYQYAISYNTDPAGTRTTRDITVGDPLVLDALESGTDTLQLAELVPLFDGTPVDVANWDLPVFHVTIDGVTQDYTPQNFEGAGPLDTAIVDIPLTGAAQVVISVANTLRQGAFELSKDFAEADGASLPIPLNFSVNWTATTPAGTVFEGTIILPAEGTPVSPLDASGDPLLFPYGTVVTYEETGLPAIPGVDWNDPVYSQSQLIIGTDGEATVSATVTNSAILSENTFLVRKNLAGIDPSQLLVDSFTVSYSARTVTGAVTTGSIQVPADGTAVGPVDADSPVVFPVGTVVTLTEAPLDEADLPPEFDWSSTSWSPSNTLVVRADVTRELEITNSAVELTHINVVKEVEGDAAGLVPDDTTFTIDWWLNSVPQPPVLLQPNVVSTTQYIPVGSIVEAREGQRPDIPGVEWGPVTCTVNGTTITPDETGLFVLPAEVMTSGATVAVVATNPAAADPLGGFAITKTVTGPEASAVPDDTVFPIEYSVDGGPVQQTTVGIGETVAVDGVPGGATVRIRETSPPPIDDGVWKDPMWTVDGTTLEPDANGWVTIQVEPGSTLAVGLVNTTTPGTLPYTGGTIPVLPALAALAMILVGIVLVSRRARPAP